MIGSYRRRSWRLIAGLGIVALWLAGLGLLARRELLRPMSARLAEAALQIQPSAQYYVIERDGELIGGASAEVDTTGYGIIFRQQLFGELIEGDSSAVTVRARTTYTPTLAFGGFRIDLEHGADSLILIGQRTGDSLLTVAVEGAGIATPVQQVVAHDPLFLPPLAALPFFLLNKPRAGARGDVTVFDPLLQRARTVPLRIERESTFVVVDSAGFDAAQRRWIPARNDTLRAWLIKTDSAGVSAWVDGSGSIVEVADGRGTRAVRTAYEIAFENWRLARARGARRR